MMLKKVLLLSLLVLGVVLTSATAQAKSEGGHDCAEITLMLPYKFEQISFGIHLDLDMVNAHGGRAFSFLPLPRTVAACNDFTHQPTKEEEKYSYVAPYARGEFFFRNFRAAKSNEVLAAYVGRHEIRGTTVIRLLPSVAADGGAYVKFRLPKGHPVFIEYSVCDSDTASWHAFTTTWKGKRSATLRMEAPIATEPNAYAGGKCDLFLEKWL